MEKILGGGFPVGAFCGPVEIMERIDHTRYQRPHYSFHGGTFTANPITMTAGLTTLKILEDGHLINELNRLGDKIRQQTADIFKANNIDVQVTGTGSLFSVYFTKDEVKNPNAVLRADMKKLLEYHSRLLVNGVFFLPGHYGALCTAHMKEDIEKLFSETESFAKALK
ncbi:aminotransferase class III-fold pyridoxal phosphate-dependent enzyme [Candidatus Bathyarchaeota archaeon]|nr:aminotransferase class III-fold pyridoxal phosphate-dependent enzyme [Candidatus Bathyarchaeota archaeon]